MALPVLTKNLHLKSGSIAYEEAGKGPVLLLVHGFCGSSSYWRRVIPGLSSAYRVIAPDLRGHGASPYGGGTISIEQLADDMDELLDRLHVDQAVVFGHSLGGYTALALAERHPGRIKGLSLIHSTAFSDSEEAKANRLKGMASIRGSGIRLFVDGLIPKLFAPPHLSSMADQVREALEIGYGTDPECAAGTLDAMRRRPDRNPVLQQVEIPVLLVAGKDDQVIPPERTFSVHRPNIRTALLENAGHMSLMECPDTLISIMTSFVNLLE